MPQIERTLPIMFNNTGCSTSNEDFMFDWKKYMVPPAFALWIEFKDGRDTILPLQIRLIGSRSHPFIHPGSAKTRMSLTQPFEPWGHLPPHDALQEKFEDCPLLQVADAHLIQSMPYAAVDYTKAGFRSTEITSYWEDADKVYAPRTYADVWYLKESIHPGHVAGSPLFGVGYTPCWKDAHHHGLSRWTEAKALIDEIIRLNRRVWWKQRPTMPFELVSLDSFDVILPLVNPPAPLRTPEIRVNGKISCLSGYKCIQSPRIGSILCEHHINKFSQLLVLDMLPANCLKVLFRPGVDVSFSLPPEDSAAFLRVKETIQLLSTFNWANIWVGDFEGNGQTSKGKVSLSLDFHVVNAANPEVEYGGDFKYIQDTPDVMTAYIQEHKDGLHGFEWNHEPWMRKHFSAARNRVLASEHKIQLQNLGFNENNSVFVHWGGPKCDLSGMGRIFQAQDDLLADWIYPDCTTIDLLRLYQDTTTLENLSLSVVFEQSFPYHTVQQAWHTSKCDSTATRLLLAKWYEEIKGSIA